MSKLFRFQKCNLRNIALVRKKQIWCASPNDYNDPYDSLFRFEKSSVVKSDEFRNYIESPDVVDRMKTWDIDEVLPQQNEIAGSQFGEKFYEFLIQEFSAQIRKKFSVCSFSRNLSSILMWTHYAENHTGYCLEYDYDAVLEDDRFEGMVFSVRYSDELFDVSDRVLEFLKPTSSPNPLSIYSEAILHKGREWEYEDEVRYIGPEYLCGTMEFIEPSAIHFGAKMPIDNQLLLVDIAERLGIPMYRMRMSPTRIELISREVKWMGQH